MGPTATSQSQKAHHIITRVGQNLVEFLSAIFRLFSAILKISVFALLLLRFVLLRPRFNYLANVQLD